MNETRLALSRVASSVTQEASTTNPELGLPVISPKPRDAGLSSHHQLPAFHRSGMKATIRRTA